MLYLRKTFSYEYSPEEADVILLGIPFDSTETGSPVRFGPVFLREAIKNMPGYDPENGISIFEKLKFCDVGDVEIVPGNWKLTSHAIRDSIKYLMEINNKAIKVFLGGEHLISLAILEGLLEFHKKITVIHFDAHKDLMPEWMGEKFSHITWAYHIMKKSGIELVQIGCRSWNKEEEKILTKQKIPKTKNPVYITVDLDVFDPVYAPEVGTPEPQGITPKDFLQTLKKIPMKNLIGFDIVECASQCVNTKTALLGAWVFKKILVTRVKQ